MLNLKKAGDKLVSRVRETMSLADYLGLCKTDKLAYATASERLLDAIGAPTLVDTKNDEKLARIFSNETIQVFETFKDIYGLEMPIKDLISFVKHAAQGLEEKKQILYLLGPVGSSKSTIVRLLKHLMEQRPFFAIEGSPVLDNPLSLFTTSDSEELGIPSRYLSVLPSPWLAQKVRDLDGDISQLKVVKLFPSEVNQVAISHVEPGDENNQDISSLVGKANISQIGLLDASDPNAYSFSGGLCKGNRGLMEFAEMFKAPIKSLNPLLEATQSGMYNGTQPIGAIPFDGLIIAHSNESEWTKFRNDKRNEALIDRIFIVKIPYTLRYSEESRIYQKMLNDSSLSSSPVAPKTLETLAKFSVMTRLKPSNHIKENRKMEVYNGENLKHKISDVKGVYELKNEAKESLPEEGFFGVSTRFAFKLLAETFNYDIEETAANPVHLLILLKDRIRKENLDKAVENAYLAAHQLVLEDYKAFLDKELRKAYIDSYEEYGQNLFDRYVLFADAFLREDTIKDPTSSLMMSQKELDEFLLEVEKPAGISNKKDFRNEIVTFAFRYQAKNGGKNPRWTAYQKIKDVIEAKILGNIEDMLPVIATSTHGDDDSKKRHRHFVDRMKKLGYTERQVAILTDWYAKVSRN
jgi:serine protein kinase